MEFCHDRRLFVRGLLVSLVAWTGCSYNLTILHTNDVHARFEQTNKNSGRCDAKVGPCYGGVARLHTKVKELRRLYGNNTIFVDAGDQYQGTIWFYKYEGNVTVHFMNELGYDIMSLGNHEFDLGPDGVKVLLTQAKFPILSANINASTHPDIASRLKSSTILEVGGQRVGFIGYTSVETVDISKPGDITFSDEVAAVQREVEVLKSKGINKIIAIGHSGFNNDLRIASEVPGVDVVVGGHSNTFLYSGEAPSNEAIMGSYPTVITKKTGNRALVVQDYAFGKYLGFLQVEFDDNGDVRSWSGNPILLDNSTAEDEKMLADMNKWRDGVDETMKMAVGRTLVFLDGNFSVCRLQECNLGNLIADAMVSENLRPSNSTEWNHVSIAFMNSGGIRFSLEKGAITYGDILEVNPFRNTVDIVEITGETILKALEYCASLWSPDMRHGGFLQFSGLRVVYDMSQSVNHRVKEVQVRCTNCSVPQFVAVELARVYKVVLPKFVADGGDGYYVITNNTLRRYRNELLDTDVLTNYIKKYSPIIHGLEGRIRFVNSTVNTTNLCKETSSAQRPNALFAGAITLGIMSMIRILTDS